MADWGVILPALGASGAFGWGLNVLREYLKSKDKRFEVARDTEIKLEVHQDGLTFQLLQAATEQVVGLRAEVERQRAEAARFRISEYELVAVEQALTMIRALLDCTADNRAEVEAAARAFLARMRVHQSAKTSEPGRGGA